MFHGKSVVVIQVQFVAKTQTIIKNMNVVNVNVTIRNKSTKKHVLKDRKPRKAKSGVDWEKEQWLKKLMVVTIQ